MLYFYLDNYKKLQQEVVDVPSRQRIECLKMKVEALEKALSEKEQEVQVLKKALTDAERLSLIDPLTGILNRRGLEVEVARALAQAQRQDAPLAVLFIDLDQFKSINDTHGHVVGDVVLKEVATFLKEVVRASDIVTRPYGDEFIIILPASDLLVAEHVANKVTKKIANTVFAGKTNVELSVGISSTSEGVCDFDELKRLADERMYKKRRFRRYTEKSFLWRSSHTRWPLFFGLCM